ncbi:phosphate transport system regulatory protein PhoU [Acidobacteriota bacterium]|nr:phosphate transport system regulatory protein PhoU [Acidobacteriota bacterium]
MNQIHLDEELQNLRSALAIMAGEVERMVELTRDCYAKRDSALGIQVMDLDRSIDEHEIALEKQCLDVLALRAPFATDLRIVASTLKIVSELERIGDHSVNISKRFANIVKQPSTLDDKWINEIGTESLRLVKRSFDSFLSKNVELARSVIKDDDIVDKLYLNTYEELLKIMRKDPETVVRGTQLILIIKNWERIADQATNIAEEVIFMVEGRNAKHSYLDDGN